MERLLACKHLVQQHPQRPDVGPMIDSLGGLALILDPGYEVVVCDDAGRKTRGRVSSISGEEVVVTRKGRFFRWFRSPLFDVFASEEDLPFGADRITRIDIVDSTWNGTAIGAAVGSGLMFGLWQAATHTNDFPAGFLYAWFAGAAPVVGIAAGHDIDLAINESVYERPSNIPRLTVAPLLGRHRGGLMLLVSF